MDTYVLLQITLWVVNVCMFVACLEMQCLFNKWSELLIYKNQGGDLSLWLKTCFLKKNLIYDEEKVTAK